MLNPIELRDKSSVDPSLNSGEDEFNSTIVGEAENKDQLNAFVNSSKQATAAVGDTGLEKTRTALLYRKFAEDLASENMQTHHRISYSVHWLYTPFDG